MRAAQESFSMYSWIYKHIITQRKSLNCIRKFSNNKLPLWREASSLMILCPSNTNSTPQTKNSGNTNKTQDLSVTNYNILLVKRSQKSSFMANAYVFPGGIADIADFSSQWWSNFDRSGFLKNSLTDISESFKTKARPFLMKDTQTLKLSNNLSVKNTLFPDLGFRITALRETFEETGILLLKDADNNHSLNTNSLKSIDLLEWQKKVNKDANCFIDLCNELKMSPDIWSLYEWSDWLTPTLLGTRRYDTMFYLCCLTHTPDISLDSHEVTNMVWCSPENMMQQYKSGKVILHPPQVYELSRLLSVTSYKDLSKFAEQRQFDGCECWMPVFSIAENGHVSYLPGDDLYPQNPDFMGEAAAVELLCSIEEHRAQSKNLHRMEIQGNKCDVHCNIAMPYNHLKPL